MIAKNVASLKAALTQKIEELKQQYQLRTEEKIFIPTQRTWFSENYQTIGEYLDEIQQTLTRLSQIQENEVSYIQHLSERLIKQCNLLLESAPSQKYSTNIHRRSTATPDTPKSRHAIHLLPPRERLAKYYEALNQLDERYQHNYALFISAVNNEERAHYFKLMEGYRSRKQKCQEAIDLLEEYLAFKELQNKEG